MKNLCSTDSFPSLLSLLLHDLLLLCSFLISHPLILAYLLLLFPYLLKLLLLLYPLLLSTFLLLLALPTVTFHLHDSPPTSSEFPVTTSSAVLNFLRAELVPDEANFSLVEQLCSLFFVDSQYCSYQMEPDNDCNSGNQNTQLVSSFQNYILLEDTKSNDEIAENLSEKTEKTNCLEHRPHKDEENNTKAILPSRKEHSRRQSEILQRDGSMRKEKEWKRTLACKLFEERMTYKLCEERKAVEGAEDMDLLWEAYEADSDKTEKQRKEKVTKKAVKEKVEEEEEEEEEDAEEGLSGQLCCLQALKLSAGKMNLGVGRPSLMKISMALKGITVFHSAGRRRKITKAGKLVDSDREEAPISVVLAGEGVNVLACVYKDTK
ncbi:uncharacterized protein LOC110038131 isoform X2 [Phalaenopsis equestris]|uniref:uncharacterized protein LOC110038131 isoform X2 n=1 Tax=Phalaenopsis equestris TaxID=78828 RepID=UPI0009E5B138|nr:uncharacterized protein LOC110038131 isoform X2 [Phalaenopsis equestris]